MDRERPTDLIDLVRHLTALQDDPTAVVAPNADLVAWSRLGSAYSMAELEEAVASQRLIELRGRLRPAEDLSLYVAEMADWPGEGTLDWQEHQREWVMDNDACRRDVLERRRCDGPLPASELPDTCVRPWQSTGWNHHRSLRILLDLMVQRGEVAAAGREGRDRLWDLAERVYPGGPVVPVGEALRLRQERRLHALGLARGRGAAGVGDSGEPATLEGVRGTWRVDPAYLRGTFAGRAALLSPLDRLVYDRKRMVDLFEFDYQLEMYKPAAKRRWGYFALPILYGDRLVGKLDTTADHRAGVLRVDAVHRDVPFSKAMARAVDREINDLARWLGLEEVRAESTT